MRVNFVGMVCLTMFCAAVAGAQAPNLAAMDIVERSVPAGPVAMVNGKGVSREDFLALYQQQRSALKMMKGGEPVAEGELVRTGVRCLGELLQRELLLQEAAKQGVTASQSDVDAAYTQEMNKLSEAASRDGQPASEAVILQRVGMSEVEFREVLREAVVLEQMRQKIANQAGITVSDAEIKEFYDDNPRLFVRSGGVHIKQIFAYPRPDPRTADEAAWEAARKKVEKALARIRVGETFDSVGADMSESTRGKAIVDLGLVPTEQLPDFYRSVIPGLAPGEISDIIRSEHGYHVIQFIRSEDNDNVTLDQARERIRGLLTKAKGEEAVEAYCQPILANEANVLVFLDLEKNLAGLATQEGAAAKS